MSKKRIPVLVVMLLLLVASVARPASIPGFFNTGVDAVGVSLTTGAMDPHFKLIASADPAYPGPGAVACSPIPSAYWYANNAVSRWIAPATDENYPALGTPHPGGDYIYRFELDLANYDPSTVVVSGSWGVDNAGRIVLNGVSTGITTTSYNPLVPFNIQSGFVPGLNHLDFVVQNYAAGGANPTGLRIEGFAGTANLTVGVSDTSGPGKADISAVIPNPARQSLRIAFGLPREGRARMVVHDPSGRAVRILADGTYPAGRSESRWDGRQDDGAAAPSGIYFARLEYGGRIVSRRIVLMR